MSSYFAQLRENLVFNQISRYLIMIKISMSLWSVKSLWNILEYLLTKLNLTWKHHIDHVAFKISRYVGLLSKLRHHVPTHTLITIYLSLISLHLTYGLLACGQACKSHLEKLLKLQKRALRFIYFSDFRQHAVPLFIEAAVLPLKFSFVKITANLMYEVMHKTAPSRIQKQFQDISNIHAHYTRSSASNRKL